MCTNIFLVINYINFKHIKKTLELEDETFFNNDWKLFKTIFIFITPHYHLLLVAANDPLGEHWSHRDLKCFPPPSVRQMMTPNFTFSLSPGTERRVLPILKVHLKVHLKFLPIICVLLKIIYWWQMVLNFRTKQSDKSFRVVVTQETKKKKKGKLYESARIWWL